MKRFINKIKAITDERAPRLKDDGSLDDAAAKKHVRQQKSYDCGPACLRIACSSHGKDIDLKKVTELCNSDSIKGTKPDEIVAAANKLGLSAEKALGISLSDLKSLLSKKIPVICAIQAWSNGKDSLKKLNDGHYVVAIGVKNGNIIFEDPSLDSGKGYIPEKEFLSRWVDREFKNPEPLQHLAIIIRKGTNMSFTAPGKLAKAMAEGMQKQAGGSFQSWARRKVKPQGAVGKFLLDPSVREKAGKALRGKFPLLAAGTGLAATYAAPTLIEKGMAKGMDLVAGDLNSPSAQKQRAEIMNAPNPRA